MPPFIPTARAYLRFTLGLRSYLYNTVTHDEVQNTTRQQILNREENFIKTLKSNVFDYPTSPYLKLLQAAKISYADVEKMVAQQGLECTLDELYEANVYVTFEEYKGRIPLKRNNIEHHFNEADFDSPYLETVLIGMTGGSTGTPTRTEMDFDCVAQIGRFFELSNNIHGVFDVPTMIWLGLLPDSSSVLMLLNYAHFGQTIARWFSTWRGNESNNGWYYTLLTYLMVMMGRFHGLKFPFPQYIPLNEPLPIVEALAEAVKQHNSAILLSTTSKCVRISLSAQHHDIDLAGVTFYGIGEPITRAKIATIEASGAKFLNWYGTTDIGEIGLPCKNPSDHTDVHFMSNHLAMIQRPQPIFDHVVDAFHFTTLLPTSPKTFLNVQLDDYGIVEERNCGCPLYEMGFTTHIRQMSSFRKLTGEGVTLVGSDMVHILEHVLPSKFGGSLLDYQLVEEENEQGFTKLVLYVDPSVPIKDENILLEAFLNAMKVSMPSVRLAQAEYRSGNVVEIRREKPIVTARGKYFPIRTLNIKS
jgi:phenylacetate-coenzyme A ligase PaaK-like adenylate-forming protein